QVFKETRQAASRRKKPAWDLKPLLLLSLTMTWCAGDSTPEKWETARAFYVLAHDKQKRPGKTFEGFRKALERLPMPVLRTLAAALRKQILQRFAENWRTQGFVPIGCDGTRLECPRSEELEQRLGTFQKKEGENSSAPMLWNTALVHLRLGIPWAWRWGLGGKASERAHLQQMLGCLPAAALLVCDAGFVGYELAARLFRRRVDFLIRMSSMARLYSPDKTPLETWRDGLVYYWPATAEKAKQPPLPCRLIRISDPSWNHDVWLLTNVTCSERLPVSLASRFYRWRWESEQFFRTYKRTVGMVRLTCRTVRMAHREAECSILATQLLLCQSAWAQRGLRTPTGEPAAASSPRQSLLLVRRAMRGDPKAPRNFEQALRKCVRECRRRLSAKAKRAWPRRKNHKPPKPPKLHPLTEKVKARMEKIRKHIDATKLVPKHDLLEVSAA
ncbi:MAG: transposase, partial [Psychrobacter sp.]